MRTAHNKRSGVKHTVESFIEASIEVHGDRYDYSLVDEYINNKTKVKIVCKIHGVFEVAPSKHLSGRNCPKCNPNRVGTDKYKAMLKNGEVEGKFKVLHLPSKITSRTNVEYVCLKCGNKSSTRVSKLLNPSREGCVKCLNKRFLKDDSYWKKLFAETHDDKYVYDNFTSKGANIPATVTCPIHGDFKITPSKHKLGGGCPTCSKSSIKFDNLTIARRNKETYLKSYCVLYFIKLPFLGEDVYKIGISKQPEKRFKALNRIYGSEVIPINILEGNRYSSIILETELLNILDYCRIPEVSFTKNYTEVVKLDKDLVDYVLMFMDIGNSNHNNLDNSA